MANIHGGTGVQHRDGSRRDALRPAQSRFVRRRRYAQAAPWKPQSPQYIQCPAPGQPLIGFLKSSRRRQAGGQLRGTILLNNGVQRLYLGGERSDPMSAARTCGNLAAG